MRSITRRHNLRPTSFTIVSAGPREFDLFIVANNATYMIGTYGSRREAAAAYHSLYTPKGR